MIILYHPHICAHHKQNVKETRKKYKKQENRTAMKIVIGSDHAGFNLKNKVIEHLKEQGYDPHDVGTYSTDSCHYPDFAEKVADAVASGEYERGILVCGTGIGMSMAANKHKGIRAACCSDTFSARLTRLHNDANILCFGERVVGVGEIGGPEGDSGLTGRKIIVDTYGGRCAHGGGAFSGKDPTKVDRSAAYYCRYIAKNLVAAGLADEVEIQVAYAIGVAKPVSVFVDSHGTGKVNDERLVEIVKAEFDLRPYAIIRALELRNPVFKKTAAYGHFGYKGFSWERTDRADSLKKYL